MWPDTAIAQLLEKDRFLHVLVLLVLDLNALHGSAEILPWDAVRFQQPIPNFADLLLDFRSLLLWAILFDRESLLYF